MGRAALAAAPHSAACTRTLACLQTLTVMHDISSTHPSIHPSIPSSISPFNQPPAADVEFASPDVHYLSSITVNEGKVYAMFVKSPAKVRGNSPAKRVQV